MRPVTVLLVLALAVVAVAGSLGAKSEPGQVAQPQNLSVTYRSGNVVFSWDPVEGATKYSLDTEGTITWSDGTVRSEASLEWDFGTDDGIGVSGEADGKVFLAIPESVFVRLALAAIEAEGADRETVVALKVDGMAKVKGLDPGKGKGRQNNLFSEPAAFEVIWSR